MSLPERQSNNIFDPHGWPWRPSSRPSNPTPGITLEALLLPISQGRGGGGGGGECGRPEKARRRAFCHYRERCLRREHMRQEEFYRSGRIFCDSDHYPDGCGLIRATEAAPRARAQRRRRSTRGPLHDLDKCAGCLGGSGHSSETFPAECGADWAERVREEDEDLHDAGRRLNDEAFEMEVALVEQALSRRELLGVERWLQLQRSLRADDVFS